MLGENGKGCFQENKNWVDGLTNFICTATSEKNLTGCS